MPKVLWARKIHAAHILSAHVRTRSVHSFIPLKKGSRFLLNSLQILWVLLRSCIVLKMKLVDELLRLKLERRVVCEVERRVVNVAHYHWSARQVQRREDPVMAPADLIPGRPAFPCPLISREDSADHNPLAIAVVEGSRKLGW